MNYFCLFCVPAKPSADFMPYSKMASAVADLRPIVVLVTEDELLIRMVAVEALLNNGFEVLEAEHAGQALSVLESFASQVHMLFTDIQMPGSMTGLELARHASSHWPWISILVASGNAAPISAEMPAGSRFLPKPYLTDRLVMHVRELAGRGNAG